MRSSGIEGSFNMASGTSWNEKMTDLFNDPQMAAYIYQTSEEHQGTVLSESEIRQLITQRWLKTCSEVRCRLCKNSTETNSLVF